MLKREILELRTRYFLVFFVFFRILRNDYALQKNTEHVKKFVIKKLFFRIHCILLRKFMVCISDFSTFSEGSTFIHKWKP